MLSWCDGTESIAGGLSSKEETNQMPLFLLTVCTEAVQSLVICLALPYKAGRNGTEGTLEQDLAICLQMAQG